MRSTRSRFRNGLAAAAALSALGVAACGGGEEGGETADAERAKFERAALAHARCMREHGVDVPDPKPGEGGLVRVGPGDAGGSPAKVESAMRECGKHLRDLPPPKLSDEQREEMREAALAHARCMREQGIDFPDPKFGPDGSITVTVRGPGQLNPDDPKMQAAERACAKHLPQLEGPEPDGGP
jgi:hypothetical protein